jgi:hypothetical protein
MDSPGDPPPNTISSSCASACLGSSHALTPQAVGLEFVSSVILSTDLAAGFRSLFAIRRALASERSHLYPIV